MDVLIVEDSDVVRQELARLLRELPVVDRIVARAGVEEALAVLEDEPFALWVLDFQLMDGTAVDLLEVRGSDRIRSPRWVVVVTAHATPTIRKRCLRAGADYFFDKAGGIDELVSTVEEITPSSDPS